MPQTAKPAARSRTAKPTKSRTPAPTIQDLYEASVQEPEAEVDFIYQAFASLKRPKPTRIREDFCGSAINAIEWVKTAPGNSAVGIDLDHELVHSAALTRAAKRLALKELPRLELIEANVLSKDLTKLKSPDAVLALNFSYWIFKQRATMLEYFTRAREALAPRGLFILDFFGGSDCLVELQERRRYRAHGGFTYIWDQHRYNPVTGDYLCKIHFELRPPGAKSGRRFNNAYEYPWRLWTIPELRDILLDAGFSNFSVFAEKEDRKGHGTGYWHPVKELPADRSFLCYLVAEK